MPYGDSEEGEGIANETDWKEVEKRELISVEIVHKNFLAMTNNNIFRLVSWIYWRSGRW